MDELKEQICELLFKRADYKKRGRTGDHLLHEREFDNVAEEFLGLVEQNPETGQVDAVVSVPELLSLAEMIREQPNIDKMLGDNGALAKTREIVYNECAGFVEQLAKGDKSVIEKM